MSYPGPRDSALHDQWRHARRVASLKHHPDRGGAPGELTAQLSRLDADFAAREAGLVGPGPVEMTEPPLWQPLNRVLRRARRGMRTGIRGARRRIPSRWPGARRYFDL